MSSQGAKRRGDLPIIMTLMINNKRVRMLKKGKAQSGPVIYWMSRDQRSNDNWALLFAQQEALDRKVSLIVCFCLVPKFLDATLRQYDFMIKGLKEVLENLKKKKISFYLLKGDPVTEIPTFVKKVDAGILVTDFEPLKIKEKWKRGVLKKISIPFYEVDAGNIVPCWIASPKQEFAAYTFRPKIHKLLDEYMDEYPSLKTHPHSWKKKVPKVSWTSVMKSLKVDKKVEPVYWIKPGEKGAKEMLEGFIKNKLARYDEDRNDPSKDGQSNLSPYLHFGQISSQRVVSEVLKCNIPRKKKLGFIEEIVVRRELSDNFCFYNKDYDNIQGIHDWAKKSHAAHRKDKRKYIYSLKQLENAKTHDELWNAAQMEMVKKGKMHGYMRMYWAKKILEWTSSPEEAIKFAIYLNDKYELDGRDTNGYVGIMWSIGGVHDRAWPSRPIFGKIRYMSFDSTKRKFNYKKYLSIWGRS